MTHKFLLRPDFSLLKKYKYLKLKKAELKTLIDQAGLIYIEIPSILTSSKGIEKERKLIDLELEKIKVNYPIKEIYDTLLYVCLHQAGEYQSQLILQWENHINSIALKQLASFIDALENWKNIESITIKSKEKDVQTTVDHPELIQWLPKKLINRLADPKLFIQGSKKQITYIKNRDWEKLINVESTNYKQLKGQNQKIFILQVLNFIRNETQITSKTARKLYSVESEFIYDIGRTLMVFDVKKNKYQADSFIRSILKYNKTS